MSLDICRTLSVAALAATTVLAGCGGGGGAFGGGPDQPLGHVTAQAELDALRAEFGADEPMPSASAAVDSTDEEDLTGQADATPDAWEALRARVDQLEDDLSRAELIARIPLGLHRGPETSVLAGSEEDTLAMLLQDALNRFAPLSATLRTDFSDPAYAARTGDFHVEAVTGDDTGGYQVLYRVGEDQRSVRFAVEDYDTPECAGCYWKEDPDGTAYWLTGYADQSFDFRYFFPGRFSVSVNDVGLRNYMTYGARTESADLRSGAATYVGYMYGDTYDMNDPDRRGRIRGTLNLTADFESGTVNGRIGALRFRPPGAALYADLPDTTRFDLRNARLADGQFVADLSGFDSDASAAGDTTVRGYEGTVLGEFYGPAAEESGGVLSARSEIHGRVLAGTLRSMRLNPRIPSGEPAIVSTAIDRDYTTSSTRPSDASRIASVESDGASGVIVTYDVDGTESAIHFEGGDCYGADPSYPAMYRVMHREGADSREYFLWDYTGSGFVLPPEFDYFNVSGWTVAEFGGADDESPTSVIRGPAVYGVATDPMPAGTAVYRGRMRAESEPMQDADHTSRTIITGDIVLIADLDNGTVGGTIDGIAELSLDDAADWADTDGLIVLRGGAIADGGFQADLRGGLQSLTGFAGRLDGRFFGPAAAETGGTIEGTDAASDSVVYGWFGGTKE